MREDTLRSMIRPEATRPSVRFLSKTATGPRRARDPWAQQDSPEERGMRGRRDSLTLNLFTRIPVKRGFIVSWVIGLSLFPGNVVSQTPSYPIGPGDVLQVAIYAGGEKQEDFTADVSPAGTMASPLIGTVEVRGLTSSEVAGKMTHILARDFFVNPQVLVSVKDYGRKIYVMGEVKKPGAYAIQEGLTVLNACILAGGFTEFASPRRVKVTRIENGNQKIIEVNLIKVQEGREADLVLQTGDRVDVPQGWF